MTTKDRVYIFDTTLRDGEQSPGATMTLEEKLAVAELLDEMGVDIIEAGFPIASEGDFEAVSRIAELAKSATVAGLARASQKDIDRCGEALKRARRSRIHTFISTSPRTGSEIVAGIGCGVSRRPTRGMMMAKKAKAARPRGYSGS